MTTNKHLGGAVGEWKDPLGRVWRVRTVWAEIDGGAECVGIELLSGVPQENVLYAVDVTRGESAKKDIAGARNACIVSLIRGGDFRRSDLAALNRADVGQVSDMTQVIHLGSKRVKRNNAVPTLDPIARLVEWCRFVDDGPLFRAVDRHGRIDPDRLSGRGVNIAAKDSAELYGFSRDTISAESFRPVRPVKTR